MLQDNQLERKQFSMFFQDEERSKSLFTNPQYLTNFLEFTNQFSRKEPEIKHEIEDPHKHVQPVIFQSDQEPRYVNQKQYHRIMIRRIKRAQQDLKFIDKKKQIEEKKPKKYVYESRHQHAIKRERGPDGKFLKKEDKQQ